MSKSNLLNITGQRYGKLTALQFEGRNRHGKACWLCRCDCGKQKVVLLGSLMSGRTKSCGCLNVGNTVHGMHDKRLYRTYHNMKRRCYSPGSHNYKYYGGRGITICDEWKNSFPAFCEWAIESGYSDDLTIDRIDVDGNYEPSNCRWVHASIQSGNRRKPNKVVM